MDKVSMTEYSTAASSHPRADHSSFPRSDHSSLDRWGCTSLSSCVCGMLDAEEGNRFLSVASRLICVLTVESCSPWDLMCAHSALVTSGRVAVGLPTRVARVG